MSRLRLESGVFQIRNKFAADSIANFPIATEMLEIHKCLRSVSVHNYPSRGKKLSYEIH